MGLVIERTPRFEEADILGHPVKIRIKFTVEERSRLGTLLEKLAKVADKVNANSSDAEFKNITGVINETLNLVVVEDEDKTFIKQALSPDIDSDDLLELEGFNEIIKYVLKLDDDEAEEDSGKASTGSE